MASPLLSVLITSMVIYICSSDKSVGFPEWLGEEYSNLECKAEGVPTWMQGTFVRHQCGAYGGPKGAEKRSISHLYDCLGMLNTFRFDNGRVTYSSRYVDSAAVRSWSRKREDAASTAMDVSWRTLFTPIDQKSYDDQVVASPSGMSDTADASPTGGIWSVDTSSCSVTAYSDAPKMYQVQLRNGQVQEVSKDDYWKGDNKDLGPALPSDSIVLHHSAHSREDAEGNLWGAMLMARNKSATVYEIYRLIYKLESKTKKRTFIDGAIPARTVDLNKCTDDGRGGYTYQSDSVDEVGYVSEVTATTTYLVLIENPYTFNPCALLAKARAAPKPFIRTWFTWRGASGASGGQVPLKFHLITKSDGMLKKTASLTSATFISRTVNAVENKPADNGYVVLDVVAHQSSDVLTKYYDVEYLLSMTDPWPADASLKRYAINPTTGNVAQMESLLPTSISPNISADFGTINKAVYGDGSYSYAYLLVQPFSDRSSIWKVDVRAPAVVQWFSDTGIYPAGEATFVPRSNQTAAVKEDDGVLLVPAFNSNSKKGVIVILDAPTLTQLGRVEAPDLITYGTYSRFLPTCTGGALSQWKTGSFTWFSLLCLFALMRQCLV